MQAGSCSACSWPAPVWKALHSPAGAEVHSCWAIKQMQQGISVHLVTSMVFSDLGTSGGKKYFSLITSSCHRADMATEAQISLKKAYLNSQSSMIWEAANFKTVTLSKIPCQNWHLVFAAGHSLLIHWHFYLFLMLPHSILYQPDTRDFLTKEQYAFQWIF